MFGKEERTFLPERIKKLTVLNSGVILTDKVSITDYLKDTYGIKRKVAV